MRLWDLTTDRLIGTYPTRRTGYGFLAWDVRGKRLALSGEGGVAILSEDGTERGLLSVPIKGVYAVKVSADGKWLANAAADGKVRLWATTELP